MLQPEELKQAQGYKIAGSTKANVTEQIDDVVPVNMSKALCDNLLASEDPSLSTFGGGLAPDSEAEVPPFGGAIEL